jgi:hypothetical protein
MNQRTRHENSPQISSDDGVREDILCKYPSDVGSICIMIRSPEDEEQQSSEEKKLASQDYGSSRGTDTDDPHYSLEKKLVFGGNYAVERSSSRNGSLSRHSKYSSDQMTQTSSDVSLATYRFENTNDARFGQCDYSNEERDAKLGVGVLLPSEHRASEKEQDMYSNANCIDQPHYDCNVSGWQQTSKRSTDGKDEDHCRGNSVGYSKRTIDQREQDLYSTTNQHFNVSSWQHTRTSPADDIKCNSREGSVDGYSRRTIEISPGACVRLRGAEETWDCIGRDFFMPCTCFGCLHELCCIQDADYVLCPKCRVVSPMDSTFYGSESSYPTAASSTSTASIEHEGGVGLGFTFDDLLKWQAEIIQGRDFRSRNAF